MKADPTGEEHVCVNNVDIHFIELEPSYYDGAQQILIRDENFNIIGGKYKRQGSKVQITTLSIADAASYFHENIPAIQMPIDYSELDQKTAEATKKAHDDLFKWSQDLHTTLEFEFFLEWVKSKVESADTETVKSEARRVFDRDKISHDEPLPERDGPCKSYVDLRKIQWDAKYSVGFVEGFFGIRPLDREAR